MSFKYLFVAVCLSFLLVGCNGEPLANIDLFTAEEAKIIGEEFIKNAPTFAHDGYGLEMTQSLGTHSTFHVTFHFTSKYEGYGDRSAKKQRIGPVEHEAVLTITKGKVTAAVLDDAWDMHTQKFSQTSVFICPQDAKECEGGSFVSRDPSNNCEFSLCPDEEGYQAPKSYCRPNQRQNTACYEGYSPVCGYFKESCGSVPCTENFDNDCLACSDEAVVYWTKGMC